MSDPTIAAKIQKAQAFTKNKLDYVAIGEKQGQYVMSQNPTVAQALEDNFLSPLRSFDKA